MAPGRVSYPEDGIEKAHSDSTLRNGGGVPEFCQSWTILVKSFIVVVVLGRPSLLE